MLEPLYYLEMLRLEMSAKFILTDSGGVQKEAFFHREPCVTLRDETEWVETVDMGWNVLAGAGRDAIVRAWRDARPRTESGPVYGDGYAAGKIVECISIFSD